MHQIIIQCKKICRGLHQWTFFQSYYNQCPVKYLNSKCPSNIIRICIRAISWVQIYLDIFLEIIWHANIFKYLFGKLCGIQIYSDTCSVHFMIFAHHLVLKCFVSKSRSILEEFKPKSPNSLTTWPPNTASHAA